jgi:hypothetical protein
MSDALVFVPRVTKTRGRRRRRLFAMAFPSTRGTPNREKSLVAHQREGRARGESPVRVVTSPLRVVSSGVRVVTCALRLVKWSVCLATWSVRLPPNQGDCQTCDVRVVFCRLRVVPYCVALSRSNVRLPVAVLCLTRHCVQLRLCVVCLAIWQLTLPTRHLRVGSCRARVQPWRLHL